MAEPQGVFSPAYKARQIAKTKASRARVAKAVQQQEIGRINAQQKVQPRQSSVSSFAEEYGILGSQSSQPNQAARQATAQSAEERAFSERQTAADRAYRTQAATTAFERQKELLEPQYTPLPQEAVSGVNRLVEEYNKAYGEARSANEARYQQLLDISDQTTGQRGADIRGRSEEVQSDIRQSLARTGLANTTVSPTLTAGVRRQEQESLNRLADEMQGTKLGIIERREDQYPDQAALQSSLSYLGEGYGGGGISALYGALGNVNQGTSVDPIPGNFQDIPLQGQASPTQVQAIPSAPAITPAATPERKYLGSGVWG